MKIKTRLRLNTWISLVVVMLMMLSLAWSFWEIDRADQNHSLVDEMLKTAIERTILRDEYLLHREERAPIQWVAKTETLRGLLKTASERFPAAQDKALLKEAQTNFDATASGFTAVLEKDKRKGRPADRKPAFDEAESRLIGQVFLKAYALQDSIGRLYESTEMTVITSRNRGYFLIVFFVLGGGMAVTINSFLTGRFTTKRLDALHEGVQIISGGDMDHRIAAEGNDELADLARESNQMAASLKESLTSIDNLNREMAERKQAEKALEKSEVRFRELFNYMSSGVAVYEAVDNGGDFIFRDFNPAAEKIEKVSRKDILGKRVSEAFPGVKAFGIFEVFQRVWQTGKPEYLPQTIYKDERDPGSWRESWVFKLPTDEIIAVYNDITERKRSEEVLQKLLEQGDQDRQILLGILEDERLAQEDLKKINIKLEQRIQERKQEEEKTLRSRQSLEAVMDSMDALAYVADMETFDLLFLNKYGRDTFPGFVPGKKCYEVLQDGQTSRCSFCTNDRLVDAAGTPTGVYCWEFQNTKTDIWFECRDQAIRWYDGHLVRLEVATDITEQKQLEGHVRQAQKLEAIGTLAGGVAHEINNPLMGIMNYAELIGDKVPKDSEIAAFTGEIKRETERVATIVRNLLSFARQEKQRHSPARMCDIVEATLSLIRAIMRHDQIALTVAVPETLPKIKCRSQQIQQVLMNLLTNSRDALNEKYPGFHDNKQLAISAGVFEKEGRPWIRTSVEDRGPGIAPHVRERVFDPFFTTKPRDKGTGLGLSISLGIVKDHGGELSVKSNPGEYTRFHVDLPVDNGWDIKGVRAAEAEETREREVRNAEGGPIDER